ncbi:hypothetical protein BVG16_16220 [Paenibacillus selenitireducens]|uniref:HTH cro/C1-type domain-containing protein n=1 Tax=Paenibacillus selenitireducens TaxID=1324314 RepID=A0A1T2XA58_9BACL|nr:hypothetical protein BVG16_16220 [Paenibacillus selenitireducens]
MELIYEGCHLEQVLERRRMSKSIFADKMGVNRSAVTNWCNGTNFMSIDNLFLACHILKCEPKDIYKYEPVRRAKQ